MSNSTVTHTSDDPRPGQKPKRSSSGDFDSLRARLGATENKIKEFQAQFELHDLEGLKHIEDETSNAIRQIRVIQSVKKKNEKVVVVSGILSNGLGVQQTRIIDIDCGSPLGFFVQAASHQLDTITYLVNHHWDKVPLLDTLSTVEENVNKKSEAASRIIKDAWLLHGIRLIKSEWEAISTRQNARVKALKFMKHKSSHNALQLWQNGTPIKVITYTISHLLLQVEKVGSLV